MLTGTCSAEYGRASGAQVMVTTKSGANDFHGSLWEFHRNSAFDARNFYAPSKPAFRRNQFGAVTGGRLRRDQTFFFLGYEGQLPGQQDSSRVNLPSAAFRSRDFSALSTPLRDPRNGNTQPHSAKRLEPPGRRPPRSLSPKLHHHCHQKPSPSIHGSRRPSLLGKR